ncbi:AUR1 Inositol phosphorylceramide synthase [Candida maltosa Xu316]
MDSVIRSKVIQKPYQLFYHYFLSEKAPTSTLSDLNFDTNINSTIRKLKHHQWTAGEMFHYGFLVSVLLFVFIVFPASFLIKLPIVLLFTTCFLVPVTSQFFLPALPIFAWLALYFNCAKIPHEWKPAITVKVLPAMETILYGDNLSNVLATITNGVLDIFAWLPYGIIHFSFPFILAALIFLFGPPTALRSYGFAFGYMNLLGVMIQMAFPAAPPWYKNLHGLEPANYSMHGSPGGLGRIDQLLGIDMYTTGFSNSPVIFGAFPSLHSGCAIMEALFLCWLFPRFKAAWVGYASYLWWSTMYLTHHYFVDLIGGAMLSLVVFEFTKYNYLPKNKVGKFCRWSYTELEKIDIHQLDPLSNCYVSIDDNESRMFTRLHPETQTSSSPRAETPEAFEMSNFSRSRQSSKNQVPLLATSNDIDEDRDEVSSSTPSVFDDEPQGSTFTVSSTTSLDELETKRA